MSEQPLPDQTADQPVADDPLDAGLAAAFGPDSGPPLQVNGSVVRALGAASRVHLRDPDVEALTPVARPSSDNMPVGHDSTGRLQLHGEIARGGMGAVLKGRDTDLGRDIAVKVLLETHQGKTELVQRFVEEAQIAGQLQHPGIAPVYELGQFADQRPYFTMKLVKGKTLAALLAARKDPAEERSKFVGIFAQVCQTLAYAHARGVIHRDLKPANVMVGAFGEVQVMDWGLAKVLAEGGVADEEKAHLHHTVSVIRTQRSLGSSAPEGIGSHTVAGSMLGTPAYMAPEQARGDVELIDERADVFGLGAILCEILTGQPPYTGKKAEVQRKAQTASLDDAYARLDGCGADAELMGLAKSCLAVEPWDRPRDAGQVTEAVTAYQNSVAERLRQAELAHAAEAARAEEAQATAAEAEAKARAERRSRRLTLALAASVLLAGVLGAAGWRWVELDRIGRAAARDARVNAALQEAVRLRGQAQGAAVEDLASWAEAVAAAKKAEALLEPGVEPALRQQVDTLLAEVIAEEQQATAAARAAERDRVVLDRLMDIRGAKDDDRDGSETDVAYAEAFREAGIDMAVLSPAEAGAKVRERPTAVALAAMLDDWAAVRRDKRKNAAGAKRLTDVAQVADPDPWRRDFRDAVEQADKKARLTALRALAQTARLDELGAVSLDLLGKGLSDAGDAPTAERILRAAQQRYPGDVWVNYDLADVSVKLARRGEAIRYFTVARALRPETACRLAWALREYGELDEAIVVLRELVRLRPEVGWHQPFLGLVLLERGRGQQAREVLNTAVAALREDIRVRPNYAEAYENLGEALHLLGQNDEAVPAYRKAIEQRPDYAVAHRSLGFSLLALRKLDEAIDACSEAIRLSPDDVTAYRYYGLALLAQGKLDEALAAFRKAIRLRPDYSFAHHSLGVALERQGKIDEAIAAYREAIRLRPAAAIVHNSLGLALGRQGKFDEALASYRKVSELQPDNHVAHSLAGEPLRLIMHDYEAAVAANREALRLKPDFVMAHNNLGEALALQGKLDEAIAAFRESLRLKPDSEYAHGNLGYCLRRKGQYAEALASFQRVHELGRKFDDTMLQSRVWKASLQRSRDIDPTQPLSLQWVREVEQMIALASKLEALVKGQAQPADAAERFTLAQMCADREWYVAAVRFWSDAFAADPQRADDLQPELRYHAARAAALAAAGKTKDTPPSNDATRAKLRQQARAWLLADLAAYAKCLDGADQRGLGLIRRRVVPWKYDPQLASLRDPDALAKLPAEEQEACRQLWAEVEKLLERTQRK
jgi:serine/threonine-protein kinase